MPTVPTVNREVQQQAFQVPVPRLPTPVKEAFTGSADTNVEIAEGINKMVGGYVEKKQQEAQWNEQARIYDSREKLSNDVTDLLTNSTVEKIKDADGVERDVPVGYLNKSGFNTQGLSVKAKADMETLRDKYLDTFKDPMLKNQAARHFNSIISSGYRQVASHEASEVRKATGDTFLASATNQVKTATLASTPDDLQQHLTNIHEAYTKYGAFKGMSPEEINKGVSPLISKAVQNSVMNLLRSSGDISQANALLDKFQSVIPEDYEKIQQTLDSTHSVMQRNLEREDTIKKVNNEFSLIEQFAKQGEKPPTELDIDHMAATGGIRDDFAVAYKSAMKAFATGKISSEGTPDGLDVKSPEEMDSFSEYMKNVMESEDKDGITGVLKQAMNDAAKGKLSQDKLKVTMFYALQRGGMLQEEGGKQEVKNPALIKLDGAFKSLMKWVTSAAIKDPQVYHDYINSVNEGASPKEAHDVAIINASTKANPVLSTLPKEGRILVDKFGNKAKVYPDGRYEEIK